MGINMDSKILSAQGAILIYKVSVGTLNRFFYDIYMVLTTLI